MQKSEITRLKAKMGESEIRQGYSEALYSLILPVYMAEDSLETCVASITGQSITDFDALLIDDGSLDLSGATCDRYAVTDDRVIVCHQRNKGVSSARNKGLKLASGEYVVFADADDVAGSRYLESLLPFSEDLVCGSFLRTDMSSNSETTFQFERSHQELATTADVLAMIQNKALSYCWAKRFKNELIRKNGLSFHEDMSLGEDTLFLTEYLVKCQSVAYSDEIEYHYLWSGTESLSSFRPSNVHALAEAHRREMDVLEARFPGVKDSDLAQGELWSILYYGIFSVLKGNAFNTLNKYLILRDYFSMPEFRMLKDNADILMSEDSRIMRSMIRIGSAPLLIVFHYLATVKERLKIPFYR